METMFSRIRPNLVSSTGSKSTIGWQQEWPHKPAPLKFFLNKVKISLRNLSGVEVASEN